MQRWQEWQSAPRLKLKVHAFCFYQMNLLVVPICTILFLLTLFSFHLASAEVWIPDNEFGGYYDSNDTFTVIGAVKNSEDKAVVPTIVFHVKDNNKTISESFTLSTVDAAKDIPFKIKLLEVQGKGAVLEKPEVTFVVAGHNAINVDVVYGKTLVKHPDGHTSGFIFNNGTTTVYGVKVYAVIYGKDGKFLDVGKSVETIDKMEPGEKLAFSMYPDPTLASKVSYYSCFDLGADPTQTVTVKRDGNKYYFTYLSSGYVTDAKFDDFQQKITLTARNPFPDTQFVNFMFPEESGDQKFSVISNGATIDFLQSKDPDGYWHVAFNLPPKSTSYVSIAGFEEHPLLPVGNYRNYLLIIIPIVAAIVSVIIWKKKSG